MDQEGRIRDRSNRGDERDGIGGDGVQEEGDAEYTTLSAVSIRRKERISLNKFFLYMLLLFLSS